MLSILSVFSFFSQSDLLRLWMMKKHKEPASKSPWSNHEVRAFGLLLTDSNLIDFQLCLFCLFVCFSFIVFSFFECSFLLHFSLLLQGKRMSFCWTGYLVWTDSARTTWPSQVEETKRWMSELRLRYGCTASNRAKSAGNSRETWIGFNNNMAAVVFGASMVSHVSNRADDEGKA